MKIEYKVGNKIVLKPWEMQQKLSKDMFAKLAKHNFTCEILICRDDVYLINFPALQINNNDIIGYYFEYGEEIEVLDDNENWVKKLFTNYDFCEKNMDYAINTTDTIFKYARRIEKKDLTFEQIKQRALAGNFWVRNKNIEMSLGDEYLYLVTGVEKGDEISILAGDSYTVEEFNKLTELDGSKLKPLNEVE